MFQGIDLQEKYDELDNIVITLDGLVDETKDEYFKDMLSELKYEAENQRGDIQEEIYRVEEKELLEQNKEFERGRL